MKSCDIVIPSQGLISKKKIQGKTAAKATRILLVDDDESVGNMAQRMLVRLGYEVTLCLESPGALETFRTGPETYDLLLTDLCMPIMTGAQLTRAVREIRPDLPVVICTGYADQLTPETYQNLDIQGLLHKPVGLRDLADALGKAVPPPAPGLLPLRTSGLTRC